VGGPEGTLVAAVIHVDRFGNCVTNITREDLTEDEIRRGARLLIGGREIRSFRRFFAEGGERGEPFAVWGSAGLLELAVFRDSAARALGAGRGQRVEVKKP
jgi:S-adenosylmethionine hydrolase